MEYVDELAKSQGKPTLMPDDLCEGCLAHEPGLPDILLTMPLYYIPDARSVVRFQADHVNRHLIPAFYRYLQAQEEEKQIQGAKDFLEAIEKLIEMFQKAEKDTPEAVGLWRQDGKLGELASQHRRHALD